MTNCKEGRRPGALSTHGQRRSLSSHGMNLVGKAFIRKWQLKHRAIADSLQEAGDRLFTLPPADASACTARRSTSRASWQAKGSESKKSTTEFGSSASCTTISDTSTWSRKPCRPSTTRSARGCHPCLRYDLSPMSPGWTQSQHWCRVTVSYSPPDEPGPMFRFRCLAS